MKDKQELINRANSYIGNGGLFNPELMEHDKVSELIRDMRDFLMGANPRRKV